MLRGLVRRLGLYPDALEAVVRGLLGIGLGLFALLFAAAVVVKPTAATTLALGLTLAVVNGVAAVVLLTDTAALVRSTDEPPETLNEVSW